MAGALVVGIAAEMSSNACSENSKTDDASQRDAIDTLKATYRVLRLPLSQSSGPE
jgi:hypothetical protein